MDVDKLRNKIIIWIYKKPGSKFLTDDLYKKFLLTTEEQKNWYFKTFIDCDNPLVTKLPYNEKENKHYYILSNTGIDAYNALKKDLSQKLWFKLFIFLIVTFIIPLIVEGSRNYLLEFLKATLNIIKQTFTFK